MRHGTILRAASILLISLTSTACATSGRFEWGAYEGALYAYSKKPERRPVYKKALERAIDQGKSANRLAPGLLAELGYLYLEEGDGAKACPLFEEEMTRFHESRAFLTPIVTRACGNKAEGGTK